NAADWGPVPGPLPPRKPDLHRAAHHQPGQEQLFALMPAFQPQTLQPLSLTSADPQRELLRQWPVKAGTAQLPYADATFTPSFLYTSRHTQEAVLEQWADPIVDVLIMHCLT